jgi:hypothetical protein
MEKNFISHVKTMTLESPDGPLTAVMIAVAIPDVQTADAFIAEVVEKFKEHRMGSPPDTSCLFVSMVGELPAAQFVRRWRELVATDQILATFMSTMRYAIVRRGSVSEPRMETLSLQ